MKNNNSIIAASSPSPTSPVAYVSHDSARSTWNNIKATPKTARNHEDRYPLPGERLSPLTRQHTHPRPNNNKNRPPSSLHPRPPPTHRMYSVNRGITSACSRAAASLASPPPATTPPPSSLPQAANTLACVYSGTTTRPASMNRIFLGVSSTMTVLPAPKPAPTRPGVDQISGRSRVVSQWLTPVASRALKGRS